MCSFLDIEKDEIRIRLKEGSRKLDIKDIQDGKVNGIESYYGQISFYDSNKDLSEKFDGWLEKKVLEYLERSNQRHCY